MIYRIVFSLLLLVSVMILPVSADTYIYEGAADSTLDTAWEAFLESLPENIRHEASDMDPETPENWQRYLSFSYWLDKLLSVFRDGLQKAMTTLASLFGILLCKRQAG